MSDYTRCGIAGCRFHVQTCRFDKIGRFVESAIGDSFKLKINFKKNIYRKTLFRGVSSPHCWHCEKSGEILTVLEVMVTGGSSLLQRFE